MTLTCENRDIGMVTTYPYHPHDESEEVANLIAAAAAEHDDSTEDEVRRNLIQSHLHNHFTATRILRLEPQP